MRKMLVIHERMQHLVYPELFYRILSFNFNVLGWGHQVATEKRLQLHLQFFKDFYPLTFEML